MQKEGVMRQVRMTQEKYEELRIIKDQIEQIEEQNKFLKSMIKDNQYDSLDKKRFKSQIEENKEEIKRLKEMYHLTK